MNALICGITGQDGAYLAQLLLAKGYEVWGTSRDIQMSSLNNLKALKIEDKVKLLSLAVSDFRSVLTVLNKSNPDEVYLLAGQSSVGLSFDQPVETLESITFGTLNMLEALRFRDKSTKFYHASSSECFGDQGQSACDENTPFRPRSPYAVAKSSAHWLVANYRESYGLHASNGILFNHESPLRPTRFVTQKIIQTARAIAHGETTKLQIGRLDIARDWGWAPDYVEAMWAMLQCHTPDDYVIATGETHTLSDFLIYTFERLQLDWRQHVVQDKTLYRPTDLLWSQGNPSKAQRSLGWTASKKMKNIIDSMLEQN